jgi:hypothetical protein
VKKQADVDRFWAGDVDVQDAGAHSWPFFQSDNPGAIRLWMGIILGSQGRQTDVNDCKRRQCALTGKIDPIEFGS